MSNTLQIIILDANEPNCDWEKKKFSPLFKELFRSLSQQGGPPVTPVVSSYDIVQEEYPRSLSGVDVVVITGSSASVNDGYKNWIYKLQLFIKTEIGIQPIVLSSDFVDEFSTATSSKPPNPMRIQLVHQDHVIPPPNRILPPNCIILGRSAQCQIQGVYWPRRLLTFQGHPEFDRHICRETTEAFLVEDLKMDSGLRKKSLQAIDQDDDTVFAITNTILAFLLLQTKGIHEDFMIVGMLWFVGGLGSWITAILEYMNEKAFEFTVFACFGAYYFSYAATMTPAFFVNSEYTTTNEFQNAIALLFLAWFFLFLLFTIAGIKTNLVLFTIFTSVTLTAAFVSASYFMTVMNEDGTALNLQKAAGSFLILGALAGWYDLAHALFKDQKIRWTLPLGELNSYRDSQVEIENQISREVPKIDIDLPRRG